MEKKNNIFLTIIVFGLMMDLSLKVMVIWVLKIQIMLT